MTGRDSAFSASIAHFDAAVEAALEVDRAGAGDDVAHAVGEDRVGQDGRGAGAVADHVAGLLRGLAQHLGAEVLLGVLEVELLGDGHAVVADDRRTPAPLDQHGLGLRPERHAHGIGQLRWRHAGSFRGRRSGNRTCLCAIYLPLSMPALCGFRLVDLRGLESKAITGTELAFGSLSQDLAYHRATASIVDICAFSRGVALIQINGGLSSNRSDELPAKCDTRSRSRDCPGLT